MVADPGNIALMITLGDLYHQVGRFEQARGAFTQVLDHDPANTVAASSLFEQPLRPGGKPVIDLINQYITERDDKEFIVARSHKPDNLH